MNVNVSYGALKKTDLCSVTACLDNDRFVLDTYDLSDNTTDSCDLVTYNEIVTHIVGGMTLDKCVVNVGTKNSQLIFTDNNSGMVATFNSCSIALGRSQAESVMIL